MKRGRPKLSENVKRSRNLNVPCTIKEYEYVEKTSKKEGKIISVFAREKLFVDLRRNSQGNIE